MVSTQDAAQLACPVPWLLHTETIVQGVPKMSLVFNCSLICQKWAKMETYVEMLVLDIEYTTIKLTIY